MSVKSIVHGLVWTGVVGLAVVLSLSSSQDHAVAGSNSKDIASTWSFKPVRITPQRPSAIPVKATPVDHRPLVPDRGGFGRAKKAANDNAAARAAGGSPIAPVTPRQPYSVFNATLGAGLSTSGSGTPSDSTGDIGPTAYVEMVNSQIGVRPRGGGSFTSNDLTTFGTASATDCVFDPQIAWDQQSGRFLYSFLDQVQSPGSNCATITANYVAFGWSKTSDPSDLAGGWCHFNFGTGAYILDFDKLGHDDNFITIGANAYSNSGRPPSQFVTAVIAVMPAPGNGDTSCTTPATLNGFGSPTSQLMNADGSLASTPVPADMTDSSPYGYVVAAHDVSTPGSQSSNLLMTWRLSSSGGTPVLTSLGDVTVTPYQMPPSAQQPAIGPTPVSCSVSGNCLDTLDGRLIQAIGHYDPDIGAETIWTQHGIKDVSVGALSVERWYELVPGNASPRQSGNVSDASNYVFNGSITPTGAGNEAVINYNVSGSAAYLSMRVQSRNSSTPLSTVANETIIDTSLYRDNDPSCGVNRSPQDLNLPCRWGDYSAARPDPTDTNIAWLTNMFTGSGGTPTSFGWTTEFAAYTPGCAGTTLTADAVTAVAGAFVHFTAVATGCANPTYAFFLQDTMGSWTLKQAFSSIATWTWDTAGYPAGLYTIHVWGNQTGDSTAHWESLGSVSVSLSTSPCSSATVTPGYSSTPVGTTINFSTSVSGCPTPNYAYFIQDPSGTWTLKRPYSTDPTFAWNTTGLAPGTYTVHIWTKQRGAPASYESIGTATVALNICTGASIAPPSTSAAAGTIVPLTASSTGCTMPSYEFFVQYPNGSWNLKQAWSSSATFNWDTSGLAPGPYTVHVWANDQADSTATYEALGSSTVKLTGCATSNASANPVSPQVIGTSIVFTASSTGCTNPVYEFWLLDPAGTWHLVRPFSATTTWTWNSSGYAAGMYTIHVWANNQGADMSTFEANGGPNFTLTPPPPCAAAGIAPPTASQPAGSIVNMTASSTGCANPQYQFWVLYLDGSWNLKQGFGGATFNWDTTGLAPGLYTVHAWASSTGSGHDSIGEAKVTLTGCATASISPASSNQAAGSMVLLTASATCPSPQFEFFVLYPNGTWYLKRAWSTTATFSWDASGLAPGGTYTIHAWANQAGASTATYETYGSATVTLTGCTSATLAPPSGTAAVGAKPTFTASSSGCPSPVYEFWLQYPDGSWHLMRTFSTTTTWTWDTTGLPKGNYVIHVWANNQGADTSRFETYGTATYTLT